MKKIRRLLLAPTCALLGVTTVAAQATAPVDAATLAKYDLNRNGVLDASELATQRADLAQAGQTPVTTTPAATGEAIQLSPFEVSEANNGYYAPNTVSGTRLNTRIEDLGASISVVTKAQMQDFAMLDINDIFAYEASTEGTGNYTAFEVDRNGMVTDQVQNNPQGANRIRGLGAANISMNGFATSGRVPIDPTAIDAVEISRGPNSSIFGLGEGSGTVNVVAASANLSREFTTAEVRVDSLEGWRVSLDINRPIIANKLALRVSGVYQHDGFERKPSGFDNRRFNAMVRYQPFRNTTIRGSFNSYRGSGNRATTMTPRDGISNWIDLGRPSWNPITHTYTVGGVSIVHDGLDGRPAAGTNPANLVNQNFSNPIVFVGEDGIERWQIGRLPADTATNGPNNTAGTGRLLESDPLAVRAGRPLFSTVMSVSNRDIYDYANINLASPNFINDKTETSMIEFEQWILNSDRHKLALQLAGQREKSDRFNRNVIGSASATGASYYVRVDPNTHLLDGTPNPYFGAPYVAVGQPVTEVQPNTIDSVRGQLAYVLDFTNEQDWKRWIGRHQMLGYKEQRLTERYRFRFRDAMLEDNPVYAPAGQNKGNQSGTASPNATRNYYHFYVGGNDALITRAPASLELGDYDFSWFNTANTTYPMNSWITETATLGLAAINEGSAGGNNQLNRIDTEGWMIQSTLLNDRLIVTYGERADENRTRNGLGSVLLPNGYEFDYEAMDGWVSNTTDPAHAPWAYRDGDTITKQFVARPFRNWNAIENARSAGGVKGFFANTLAGLSGHYNESNSFRPETPAISITLNELPNPTSEGKDYGFSLNLGNKLVLRYNKYETNQINSRAGQSAVFATRAGRVDFAPFKGENDAIALQRQARNWLNPDGTRDPAVVATEVAAIMQLPEAYLEEINNNTVTETSDVITKGNEIELQYNPNSYWTLRANVTRSESIDKNLSPNIPAWLAVRLPIWETIIDPRAPNPGPDGLVGTADDSTGRKWLDTPYSGDLPDTNPLTAGNAVPRNWLQNNVISGLALAQVLEGKSRPQIREWRVNVSTSYRLAGLFQQKHLQRMSVGGGIRWESKGAIGFFGVPDPVTGDVHTARALDGDRPIYDGANLNVDLFATYTTRMLNDRVRARFQLNVRNVQESRAHLRPVGAYPNGVAHTFRIIDPRTFILSATFDL